MRGALFLSLHLFVVKDSQLRQDFFHEHFEFLDHRFLGAHGVMRGPADILGRNPHESLLSRRDGVLNRVADAYPRIDHAIYQKWKERAVNVLMNFDIVIRELLMKMRLIPGKMRSAYNGMFGAK